MRPMRHAAMAFARALRVNWWGETGRGAPIEALEERLVLSAPTITPLTPTVTTTRVLLPVQYHSDSPIDLSTIGDGDIGATGPDGFAQLAKLFTAPVVLDNGDVVVVYALTAPGGQWNWPDANGTYNVGVAGDAVRNTAGEGIAEGGAGSYWLWFDTAKVTASTPITEVGQGPLVYDLPRQDGWNIGFTVQLPIPTYGFLPLIVHVTGPNGFETTQNAVEPYLAHYRAAVSTSSLSMVMAPPGGTWDFSDSGSYTVQASNIRSFDAGVWVPGDVVSTQTYTLNFTAPRAEVVATSVGTRDLRVTMRYVPAPGSSINLSSISDSDIMLWGHEPVSHLLHTPTLNTDGSVTADYSIPSTSPGGWNWQDSGPVSISLQFNQVQDSAGRAVGVGPVGTRELQFDEPSVIGVQTLSAASIAWDVEATFRNVGALIDTTRLSGLLAVYNNPGSGEYMPTPGSVQLLSFSNSADNILTARYRILPPTGGVLTDQNYHLLVGNPYNPSAPPFYASLDMHFAGATVMGLQTLSRTSTTWDIEMAYTNPGSIINTGSLGTQNLLVTAPMGRTIRISMTSLTTGSDRILRVRYRILASTNGGTLAHGTYGFALRPGSVFAGGVALPGQSLESMTF